MERRFQNLEKGKVSGYAIRWNQATHIDELGMPEFFEPNSIEIPECGVPLFFEHEPRKPLGNSKAGTLKFENKPEGLWFECELPKSCKYEREAVARGDIQGASIAFLTERDAIENGQRRVESATLQELSLVTSPAHKNTEVTLRKTRPRSKRNQWTRVLWDFSSGS